MHTKAMLKSGAVALATIILTILIGGCGGVADDVPQEPQAAIVVVGVIDKETQDFLDIPASVVLGGVRGTATPKEGSVVIRDIPFGTETPPRQPLSVSARGYKTVTRQVQLSVTSATFETVELETVDLEKTGIVGGYVTSDEGEPVTMAHVSFEYEQVGGDTVVVDGFTDKEGYYIIGGIPIGRVTANASADGYLSYGGVANVVQGAGQEEPQELNFELITGETKVTVRGRVTNVMTTNPIEGAEVTIGDRPTVTTNENGSFSIPEVLVGEQRLTVSADGFDEYNELLNVTPTMDPLLVQMNPAAPDPPGGPWTIRGTVTLAGKSDNAGAQVEVFDTIDAVVAAETVTDADGEYRVFVRPGEYRITVEYEEQSISRDVTVPGGGAKVSGIDFTLTVD
ncbi:MAG: carboxypeptidase-like regulatory domain-containing protein [Armatimonadota bacterium]